MMLRMFVVRCRTSGAHLRIGSRRAIASARKPLLAVTGASAAPVQTIAIDGVARY